MAFNYKGMSFEGIRLALLDMFFGGKEDKKKFVIPATHNFDNPIEISENDTYIEFWVLSDSKLGADYADNYDNICEKVAEVEFRFIGAQAERWAKLFHHIYGNKAFWGAFYSRCCATSLDYVSPITPFNVLYAEGANSAVGFLVVCKFQYEETLYFDGTDAGKKAMFVSLDNMEINREA